MTPACGTRFALHTERRGVGPDTGGQRLEHNVLTKIPVDKYWGASDPNTRIGAERPTHTFLPAEYCTGSGKRGRRTTCPGERQCVS